MSSKQQYGYRSALNKEWLWPIKDKKAWPYLTKEENILFPKVISNMIPNHRAVIQAGGHCGLYPYQYSSLFENVYTFEPEYKNYNCLVTNLKDCQNTVTYNLGLGNKLEKMGIKLDRKNSGKHMITDTSENAVSIITIDSLNLSDVDLIHLDLEGYELFALQGAIETIKRYKPLIVLETNDLCNEFGYTINELESWIYSVGYKKTKEWADDCAYEYDTTVL